MEDDGESMTYQQIQIGICQVLPQHCLLLFAPFQTGILYLVILLTHNKITEIKTRQHK